MLLFFFSHFLLLVLQIRINWIGVFFQSGIDQFPKNINKSETVNHKCVFYDLYAWYLGEYININADLDLCIHFLIKLYVCVTSFCLSFFSIIHYWPERQNV